MSVTERTRPTRQFARTVAPTGRERRFDPHEIIVSKTDTKGIITYANEVFLRVSMLAEHEALGAPHSIIRHPAMPRTVFKLLWDRISSGREIFALVNNLARNGDNYWVLAHVTPSFDRAGRIVGYHSNRRVPDRTAVVAVTGLYAGMKRAEDAAGSRDAALVAGSRVLEAALAERELSYDQFVFSL